MKLTFPEITPELTVKQSEQDFEDHPLNMSHFLSYLDISYDALVKIFGQPNETTDGYKVDAEWMIMTPDGAASIYNYKDGHNYNDGGGFDVQDIRNWHVGGHQAIVAKWVADAVERNK